MSNTINKKQPIPSWIIIYGVIQVILVIGFGAMFFVNSNPTVANDPSWFVGSRNLAILAVLLIGLIRRDVKYLFTGYLLRFIVDLGDMFNNLIAGELFSLLIFVPFLLIPLGYGTWTLWQIAED